LLSQQQYFDEAVLAEFKPDKGRTPFKFSTTIGLFSGGKYTNDKGQEEIEKSSVRFI
jgi:hypothetical protein